MKIRKSGDEVILAPVKKPSVDLESCWAELDALGAKDFLPDGISQDPPLEADQRVFFDEDVGARASAAK